MENIYEICFYGGLILAILLLITSVILFIVLKIPKVFGDLTGRNAKKGIKERKEGITTSGSVAKKEQAKYYNQNTGKITVREGVSEGSKRTHLNQTTDNLKKPDDEETSVLNAKSSKADEQTTLLSDEQTTPDYEEATEVLIGGQSEDATELLSDDTVGSPTTEVLNVVSNSDTKKATVTLGITEELIAAKPEPPKPKVDTPILVPGETATDVLITPGMDIDDETATSVLVSNPSAELAGKVKVEYNIVITHTDERL